MARKWASARNRAEQLVALSQQSGQEALLLEAIHCRWSTAFFRGDIAGLLADAREGIGYYRPERHRKLGAEFGGHDPGVCAHSFLGLGLAQFGSPREARDSIDRGLALGEELNDPISVAYSSMIAVTAYQIIGDRSAVSHVARRTIELAEKFNLPPQLSVATFMSGWASASGDTSVNGRQIMELEFERVSALGPIPLYYAGLMAGVWLEHGQFERAIGPLDTILNTVDEPGVGFFLPEIHRLRAECLLRFGPSNFDEAVREFEIAIAAAKQQQSRAFELRAAIGLAGAWAAQGEPERGTQPLQEIVGAWNGDDGPTELGTARLILSVSVPRAPDRVP